MLRWVPEEKDVSMHIKGKFDWHHGASITEMEIRHALNRAKRNELKTILFLRDTTYSQTASPRGDFVGHALFSNPQRDLSMGS